MCWRCVSGTDMRPLQLGCSHSFMFINAYDTFARVVATHGVNAGCSDTHASVVRPQPKKQKQSVLGIEPRIACFVGKRRIQWAIRTQLWKLSRLLTYLKGQAVTVYLVSMRSLLAVVALAAATSSMIALGGANTSACAGTMPVSFIKGDVIVAFAISRERVVSQRAAKGGASFEYARRAPPDAGRAQALRMADVRERMTRSLKPAPMGRQWKHTHTGACTGTSRASRCALPRKLPMCRCDRRQAVLAAVAALLSKREFVAGPLHALDVYIDVQVVSSWYSS